MPGVIEGTVVSMVAEPYDFTDKRTGERVVGVSHKVTVVTGSDEPVSVLKIKPDEYAAVEAAGAGCSIRASVWVEQGPVRTTACEVVGVNGGARRAAPLRAPASA